MKHPYVWNTINTELCYGRDDLLTDLLEGLPTDPPTSFGIAGGRRMGKTTLLRRVERDLRAGIERWRQGGLRVIPIYVDGLALPRPLSVSDIWALLFREIQSALMDRADPLDQSEFDGFKRAVGPVLRNLDERPRVIIIFDEIEPIVVCDWADAFLSHWRALLSNTPGLSQFFSAVFAGARETDALRRDVGSPLKDVLEWRSLRSLRYEDACALMQNPIDTQWSDPFLRRVYRETGGHPMLLQYVMQHVCDALRATDDESAACQLVERAVTEFSLQRGWQFGDWWGRYCSPTAQRIYARLPDDGSLLPLRDLTHEYGLDEANDGVEILQHVGLATAPDDVLSYRYSGEMFRSWYRRYGSLTDAAMHDAELHRRLSEIGEDLSSKYISAWRSYQTKMPNYSGLVHEMRDILTHLLNRLAPDDQVGAEADFQPERGQSRPTRRQRVRYVAHEQQSAERTREIVSDYELLETECDLLSRVVSRAYASSSGLAHTTTTRVRAYRVLKQWESIFAQLIPMPQNDPSA